MCFVPDVLLKYIKTPVVVVSDYDDPEELQILMQQDKPIDFNNLDAT